MDDMRWMLTDLRARSKRTAREAYSLLDSVYEPAKSVSLTSADQNRWDKLDRYYRNVKSTVLNYQSPATGLFPSKTIGNSNNAKVRDCLYCAASAWAVALAYRRIDDDKGRTHELEYCAVKCMRGILYCYMRQADKVENFKQHSNPSNCLHSVFNVHTGDEVLSNESYGHLQIDAVSLFLLYLVEMISSGLQIIYNTDESVFQKNLSIDYYQAADAVNTPTSCLFWAQVESATQEVPQA
ncbi:hypothetical protein scyTo_0004620 [Scyliorhinus torazame]|uniref:Phosphorylase b kinase regulatory subunit n=1 Tax=Scyliorhinus torazame TaxID=75743 RepID=A0A401NUD7_SCYTO|nr:hypothetical protein [Scyliorhinus torazame]